MNDTIIEGKYLAFVLDNESRTRVLQAFPPRFERVTCDHVTMNRNPTVKHHTPLVGTSPKVVLYRHAFNERVECVIATVDGSINRGEFDRASKGYYHVTISFVQGAQAYDSNTLLNSLPLEWWTDCLVGESIPVTGTIQLLQKGSD